MKQKIGKYIPKTFDEVILVLLQTIIFILFFFTEALGTPTRNEYMAKSLTDAAKSSESGLVYSLIVPPSDTSNFNYLEYHLSFLNSSDFIDDCYIFTINYCNYESNLYPFGVNRNPIGDGEAFPGYCCRGRADDRLFRTDVYICRIVSGCRANPRRQS